MAVYYFSTEHVLFLLVLGKFECGIKRTESIAMLIPFLTQYFSNFLDRSLCNSVLCYTAAKKIRMHLLIM